MTRTLSSPSEQILDEVRSWPGVSTAPGRRGELSITVGRREIGHLHGDRTAHFGFPRRLWSELVEQGRVVRHPIDHPGWAARRIDGPEDVAEVVALLRLNYERAVRHAPRPLLPGLYASAPEPLPFAPGSEIRAFGLRRPTGDVLVYSVRGLDLATGDLRALGRVTRHYLNHGHEAMFAAQGLHVPLFVHAAEREAVERTMPVRAAFTRRHTVDGDLELIPAPGHTPGATAVLWHGPEHRFLFTGDTVYLDGEDWVAAVLASSDREAYLESLALLAEVEFDVLVPWAASAGGPAYAPTGPDDARARLGAIAERVRAGENR